MDRRRWVVLSVFLAVVLLGVFAIAVWGAQTTYNFVSNSYSWDQQYSSWVSGHGWRLYRDSGFGWRGRIWRYTSALRTDLGISGTVVLYRISGYAHLHSGGATLECGYHNPSDTFIPTAVPFGEFEIIYPSGVIVGINSVQCRVQGSSGYVDIERLDVEAYSGALPTPTPVATATPAPPSESQWGLTCSYTDTQGIEQTIGANLLSNGSFETGGGGWYSVSDAGGPGGTVGGYWSRIGPASGEGSYAWRYATDGDYSLWKDSFSDTLGRTYYVQDLYLNSAEFPGTGNIILRYGVDWIPGETGEPGATRAIGMGKDLGYDASREVTVPPDPFAVTWGFFGGEVATGGGGFRFGILAGPGEASVYFDRAYVYAGRGSGASWEVVCPSPEVINPPSLPTPAPLGTAGPTPTIGPITTDQPPGIEITPAPTRCLGWSDTDVPGMEDDLPGVQLCIEPSEISFSANNPFNLAFGAQNIAYTLFVGLIGVVLVGWIRSR